MKFYFNSLVSLVRARYSLSFSFRSFMHSMLCSCRKAISYFAPTWSKPASLYKSWKSIPILELNLKIKKFHWNSNSLYYNKKRGGGGGELAQVILII